MGSDACKLTLVSRCMFYTHFGIEHEVKLEYRI